jgi:glutamate racemase
MVLQSEQHSSLLTKPNSANKPIGVFDSGVGGLTVVAALRRHLPNENIIYLGDTARVPYGGKSPETVLRYSKEIANLLLEHNAKMIVIACNTASALALSTLTSIYSVPIHGVIEPGAAAAVRVTKKGIIGVIGTRATIASKAYQHAIHHLSPKTDVLSYPCPLLVPLVEEGLFDDEITQRVLERYLEPMLSQGIDSLVLGCTHYPLLKKLISKVIGPNVTLVDSAENCALAVQTLLTTKNLAREKSTPGTLHVLLTDTSEDFLHSAANALKISIDRVSIITLY